MAGNFIPMVFAVLEEEGIDVSDLTIEQAIQKYNALRGKGKTSYNDNKVASKGNVDYAKEYADNVAALNRKERGLKENPAEEHSNQIGEREKNLKPIILPKKEYAELCSAIRTKYANKIPKKGEHIHGNHYYWFIYNERACQIVFVGKYEIDGQDILLEKWGGLEE